MWNWLFFCRYLLEFFMLIPAAVCCLLPVLNDLRIARSRVFVLAGVFLATGITVPSVICTLTGWSSNALLLPLLLTAFLLFRSVCTYKTDRLLFVFFNATTLMAWSSMYTLYLTTEHEMGNYDAPLTFLSSAVSLGLAILTMLIYASFLYKKLPSLLDMPRLDKLWRWFFLLPLAVTLFFIFVVPIDLANLLVGRIRIISLFSWAAMILIQYALYQFLWYVAGHLGHEEQLRQENLLLHAEEDRYRQLQEHLLETRVLRHDFRQHIRVLSELAGKDDPEELRRYLADYVGSIGEEHEHYCANAAVDALAAWYRRSAKQHGTAMECQLLLPRELPLNVNDYCMILGNLLENALHASVLLPEEDRIIRIKSSMIGGQMLGLSVSNRIAGPVPLDKTGMPVQKEREGIGLRSVASAVAKSNGSMVIDTDNGWFNVNILFNLSILSQEGDLLS